jgi:hypothetical protein
LPTFSYFGQTLTIDTLYSYARVSSDIQTIEAGGEGIPRQLGLYEEFASQYGITVDNLTGQQFIDSGLSGSKGDHLKNGAGLAAFMKMAVDKKLGANPGLTVESFSRLGRMPIDLFNKLFWSIIEAGVVLITLKDHRAYSRDSVRNDKGQVYQIQAAMQAASSYAEDLAYYTAKSWKVRRGTAAALAPAWFDKFIDNTQVTQFKGAPKGATLELRVNSDKLKIIDRIFKDVLTHGIDRLIRNLNREGVPTFAGRGKPWNPSSVGDMIRGRMVLGEQEVHRYVDGVRTKTGEVIKDAYPAVVTEEQWMLANAAVDGRKSGVMNGRNVTKMTNLFGDLARCETCGGRMKIKQKGRVGQFKYLGCSNATVGKCDNKTYQRLDHVETVLMALCEELALGDWTATPIEDQSTSIKAQIAHAKAEAGKIVQAYERALQRSGAMAEQMQLKLEGDHAAKLDAIKMLERQLAKVLAVKPAEQAAIVKGLAGVLGTLSGDTLTSARARIASALPSIVARLEFSRDRSFRVTMMAGISVGSHIASSLGLLKLRPSDAGPIENLVGEKFRKLHSRDFRIMAMRWRDQQQFTLIPNKV